MSAKHTSGPWYRNIRANGHYPVIFAGRNQHVATATQQADPAETEANIDLLAAAPDLLGALKQILSLYESDPDDLETMDTGAKIARAAIAKATGGTP